MNSEQLSQKTDIKLSVKQTLGLKLICKLELFQKK